MIGAAVAMLALLTARTRALAAIHLQASHDLDQLVLLEVGCVVLLLAAIGIGVRVALRPTHARLVEATAALEEHESRTRAVLDAMEEGTLLFASDGTLIDANPSAARILGVAAIAPGTPMLALAGRLVTGDGIPFPPHELPAVSTTERKSARSRSSTSACSSSS